MSNRYLVCGTVVLSAMVTGLHGPAANASDFERHAYVFVSAGEADTDRRLSIVDVIDGEDDAYEIGAGYALSRYLSLEASYQRFGEPDGFVGCPIDVFCIAIVPFAREDVKVDGWSLAVRGSLPVTKKLSVFARAGLLAWDASARSAALEDSDTDLFFGAGLAADITQRFGVQVSHEQSQVDTQMLKLGLRVRL